jgi:acyl carrier protein
MSAEVFDRIKDLIVTKKGVEAEKVNIDSSFEELGMDSLDAVELVADMEEIFDVICKTLKLFARLLKACKKRFPNNSNSLAYARQKSCNNRYRRYYFNRPQYRSILE